MADDKERQKEDEEEDVDFGLEIETADNVETVENNENEDTERVADANVEEDTIGKEENNKAQNENDAKENDEDGNDKAESEDEEDEEMTPAASGTSDVENVKYKEYKQIVKEIKKQNELINSLKKSIIDIMRKPCNTNCDKADLKSFLNCMDCEMTKLRNLINKAMNLQNFGSNRFYNPIELATSFEEDQLSTDCD